MAQHKDGSVGERDGLEEEEIEGLSDEEGGLHIDDIYIPPPTKPACSVESIGPRLIITKIVNDFFKSYAHEEILGPFHQRFNAIIGPNGSGKSNVIDSMLFVFGYRASKIRSKKISVLLHNSERFKNTQSCTVSVHFALIVDKEGDDYDIVPNSEFVVTRTANKDNSSFYQLDGKRVQFKEVARLLKHHGVDLDHNRFLILQGEVEQISLMKPKAQNEHETGMLEYLEDIIGTSRYKVPLAKLEDRVEVLSEQRTEKLNRVKLVQKDLEELKGPMQEAVEYLRVENLVAECKNVLFQKYIVDLNAQMVEKKALETEILGAQQEITDKIKELVKEIKTKEDQMRTESKKYESLEEKRNSMKTAFDVATNRDSQLQADMTQINKTRKKTKQLLAEEKQKLEKLERVPEENARAIEQCETKEQQMTAKKEKLDADRMKVAANIRAQTQDLQDKKDQLLTELMQLNEAVDTAKASFTMAESELQMYLSNETAEATKLQNLKSDHEECEQLINERTESVKELKKKIPATEKSLAEAKQELATLKGEESRLIDDLRHKRMNLEQTRSSMQATRSRGRVLDSLVQQKREGKCPGLFGRLGDLGAIDQKFDVAVSTACGPLDHIVVDTVATAQWCIEFLKKHDIGRASFIALDKQEHLRDQANGKINTPENVPRLFDLIRIEDERVKTAFYFALRNTLVATDLDQASRIAYGAQRFRVVTLNGDLIETAGTMSGGGKNVSRGRMGQSVAVSNINQGDFEQLEAELLELETRIKELRVRQNALENSINYLDPELRQMKIDYEKFSSELESLKQQQPLLIRKLKDQEAKCKSTKANPQEVQRLRDVLDKKRAEYDEASELASGLQAEVDAVTKAIEDKTIGKLKILDKDIKEAVAVIGKCKKEITRLNVAIKTSERNVRISNEKIATFEQDIGKCESDLLAMKAEREVIEEEARKLLVCIEELSEELAKKEEGCSEIKQEVDKIKKKENKLKLEKVEIDEKVKNITHATKDIASNINRWNAKIKQLTLQEIPEETTEPLKTFTEDELKSKDTQHVELELQAAEERLKQNKPNFSAIQQFHKKRDEYIAKSKELDEISEKKRQMRDMYETVRTKRREEFLIGYNIIRMKLKEMYQMITLGGDANFDLVDTFDPFNEGVQFNVRPPKKSWKVISNLSGGEKTLSSLALVFALHYYKPSPLYVMDEIDAALDFKNVSIVGHYIKERTKNAQFIIISLRSNMFELCDNLIGIYKVFSCTRSATIDPRKFENVVETQHVPDAQQHVPETQQHVPETQHVPEVTNDVPEVANDLNNSDSIVQSDEDESVDEQMDVSS